MNKELVIILFNGFGSSKLWWDYALPNNNKPVLRKLDFLDKLKKIGKTYTFNQPFFNVSYYETPINKKEKLFWKNIHEVYKEHSPNINFQLEDLDFKNICEKTYNAVKKKYGNNKKYVVVCHSYGSTIGLLFSKLYKNDCILCCYIDNNPFILSFFNYVYNKYIKKNKNNLVEKYSNNEKLKKSLNIIKNTTTDNKEKNKEINDILGFIGYRANQDQKKYYDNKLYVPTIFFRAYYPKPNKDQIDWNKYVMIEKKLFEKDKNMKQYIIMNDADHYIWENQEFSDIIIDTIKQSI
jgi:hypothetical protein